MSTPSWDTRLVRCTAIVVLAIAPVVVTMWLVRARLGPAFSRAMGDSLVSNMLVTVCGASVMVFAAFVVSFLLIRRGYRPQLVRPIVAAVAMLGFGVLIVVANDDGLSTALGMWWLVPFMIGSSIMGAAVQRVGDERFCVKCVYPFLDDPGVEKCPECGASWRTRFGTVAGKHRTNRRLMRIGAGFMVAGMAASVLGSLLPGTILRLAPTSMLIQQAVYTRSFDTSYWKELSTRKLSFEQTMELAEGVLSQRDNGAGMSRDDELWIDGQFRAGALLPEIVQRYFEGMVGPPRIVQLVAPAAPPAAPGAGETLQLEAMIRTNLANTQDARIIVEGWWIDGVFTPTTDTGKVLSTYALDSSSTMTGPITPIRLTLPSAATGPMRVKFTGWIAVGPFPGVAWQCMWASTPGTPGAVPTLPGATSWIQRFEVSRIVQP